MSTIEGNKILIAMTFTVRTNGSILLEKSSEITAVTKSDNFRQEMD